MQKDKLPVLEIIYKSIAYPWHYRKQLSLALLPTFLALVSLGIASLFIPDSDGLKSRLIFPLLGFPVIILYSITIHRFLILGPDSIPKFGVFQWRGREWEFLAYTIGLGMAAFLLAAVPVAVFSSTLDMQKESILHSAILLVIGLPAVLLFARLSLMFPAIATDSNFSFRDAWNAGRGNTFRLAIVLYWADVISGALTRLLPGWLFEDLETFFAVAGVFIGYILWAIQIAGLSFAYKHLIVLPEAKNP